jgi:hypothetical protein
MPPDDRRFSRGAYTPRRPIARPEVGLKGNLSLARLSVVDDDRVIIGVL